jgi:hypothetical protein
MSAAAISQLPAPALGKPKYSADPGITIYVPLGVDRSLAVESHGALQSRGAELGRDLDRAAQ